MDKTYAEDEIYQALGLLHATIPWVPDSLQDNLIAAERLLRKGIEHLNEPDDDTTGICYTCKHMCAIRRKYVGASMMACVKYEKRS